MRPVLLEFQGFRLPGYGATLATLFVAGLLLFRREVRRLGVSDWQMLDLATISGGVILAWVGAGVLLSWLRLDGPPHLNALPVLAVGAFAWLWYLRREKLPAERIFDAVAPIAALALAIQYGVGTLLAGTAFGVPTDLPWGLSFPPGSPAYRVYGAVPLHPVQLYLGFSFLAVAAAARFAPGELKAGQRALMTFVAMATVYLALSPLRGNTTSFLAGGRPRMSEMVALFIVVYCIIMAWRARAAAAARKPAA
jgi:phosphatidylglycerol:prolipoprotein diacylglycerol transferase